MNIYIWIYIAGSLEGYAVNFSYHLLSYGRYIILGNQVELDGENSGFHSQVQRLKLICKHIFITMKQRPDFT